jgi:hypothetical protein
MLLSSLQDKERMYSHWIARCIAKVVTPWLNLLIGANVYVLSSFSHTLKKQLAVKILMQGMVANNCWTHFVIL